MTAQAGYILCIHKQLGRLQTSVSISPNSDLAFSLFEENEFSELFHNM